MMKFMKNSFLPKSTFDIRVFILIASMWHIAVNDSLTLLSHAPYQVSYDVLWDGVPLVNKDGIKFLSALAGPYGWNMDLYLIPYLLNGI